MDVKPRERKQKWAPPGREPLLCVSYLLNLGGISSDHLRQISATVRDSLVLQTHGNSPSSLNPIFFQHVLQLYHILVITTLVSNSYLTEYTPSPSFIKINHNYYYSKWLIDISDALYRPGHFLERMKVEGQHGPLGRCAAHTCTRVGWRVTYILPLSALAFCSSSRFLGGVGGVIPSFRQPVGSFKLPR